jgi:hypothetical protein
MAGPATSVSGSFIYDINLLTDASDIENSMDCSKGCMMSPNHSKEL